MERPGEQDGAGPRLYAELADWFHLVTAPEEYDLEAAFLLRLFAEALGAPPTTLLELGSGGGNMASHYKRVVPSVTLTDRSAAMLALSQRLNPECQHVQGDMRALRLGRLFDAVLVHDAVCYLTGEDDLRRAAETAFAHCRPGGAAIFAPDHLRENFAPTTDHGGHDGAGRALRYLEWTHDPDPTDTTCLVDYVFLLHEDGQPPRVVHDRHVNGLFDRATWLGCLGAAGFAEIATRPLEHPEVPLGSVELFVARRR